MPDTAVKAAPSGRWTLRDKAPRRALYLHSFDGTKKPQHLAKG